jgi:hypothetical protein
MAENTVKTRLHCMVGEWVGVLGRRRALGMVWYGMGSTRP